MRLAPALLTAALAAIAAAHEFQGEHRFEHDGHEHKSHKHKGHEHKGHEHKSLPVGQYGGQHQPGHFKEASWWEKLQGKHAHYARDAETDASIPDHLKDPATHPGKHHKAHHHHQGKEHKDPHRKGPGAHEHHKHEKEDPRNTWHWFSKSSPEIIPRGESDEGYTLEQIVEGHDHKGHQKQSQTLEQLITGGQDLQPKTHHKHGHKHGHSIIGEHPHNEISHFYDKVNHHKRSALAEYERDLDTDEVDPDNEFFDDDDFDDDDFDDDEEDEAPELTARDVDIDAIEQTADPNEISGDEDYYDYGDDGDDDILAGELEDAEDVDDDGRGDEADLDDDDEDDDPDDGTDDGDDNDDDDDGDFEEEDDEGVAEKMKRWAEPKKHHKKPKPKPKGWGIFPW